MDAAVVQLRAVFYTELFGVCPRPDLLELANSFRGDAWGKMRALERWVKKQPWRQALPQPFQILACNSSYENLCLVESRAHCACI